MAAPLGNKNALKSKPWEDALKRALSRSGTTLEQGLNKVADKVVALALEGDRDAWQEVANRLDGRARQAIELSGEISTPEQVTLPTAEQLKESVKTVQ